MSFTLEIASKSEYKLIKRLFISAFPKEERPPFFVLSSRAKRGNGDMLIAKDNGEFIGFIYVVSDVKLSYLFFLAVEDSKRGMGYGTKIPDSVKTRYSGNKIFLAREGLDEPCDNMEQRQNRHKFYLKNRFVDLDCKIVEGGVVFDAMSIGGEITNEEYTSLIDSWCGEFARKRIGMYVKE
jgi:hypothetical protein